MALSRQNPIVEPSTVVVHIGLEALRELFSATRRERASRRVSGATPGPIPRGGGGSRARRLARRGVAGGAGGATSPWGQRSNARAARRDLSGVRRGPLRRNRCARAGSYGEAKKIFP